MPSKNLCLYYSLNDLKQMVFSNGSCYFCVAVHEGALVQGLAVLSLWCSHFSTEVPKALAEAFKVRSSLVPTCLQQFQQFTPISLLAIN